MKRYTPVLLSAIAVLCILAAMFAELKPTANVGAETAHVAPLVTVDTTRDGTLTQFPVYSGTGECGYYHEAGMIHRNEFLTPPQCFHDNGAPLTQPTVTKHTNKHTKDTVTTPTTPTIDNGGVVPTEDKPNKPTKSCHNKNSGKDGTPNECNAGRGQEKHGDK